jgi:hypothetical protein
MAGQRLTDKTALNENLQSGDLLMAVDVSDTTGSAQGTSKQITNKFIIQTDKLSLVAADFQALDDTGAAGTFQTLVAAPGSGFAVIPLNVCIITSTPSVPEASNNTLYFGYDSSQTTLYWNSISRWNGSVLVATTYNYSADGAGRGSVGSSIDNLGFYMYANNNLSGTYTADVYTTYQIVKL